MVMAANLLTRGCRWMLRLPSAELDSAQALAGQPHDVDACRVRRALRPSCRAGPVQALSSLHPMTRNGWLKRGLQAATRHDRTSTPTALLGFSVPGRRLARPASKSQRCLVAGNACGTASVSGCRERVSGLGGAWRVPVTTTLK